MMIRRLGRTGFTLLAKDRCSSSYCARGACLQYSSRVHFCTRPQVVQPQTCGVLLISSQPRVSFWRPQWHSRLLATTTDQAAASAPTDGDSSSNRSSVDDEEDGSSNVRKATFDAVYVNYFALTGILERPMASCRTLNGGYEFTLTVFEGQGPGKSFVVEATYSAAVDISNNIDQLPQGVLLSVEGRLSRSQGAYNRKVTKLLAGFVGIIDDVPDHIAAAAAAAAAFRDNSAAGSAAALTPGEGGMPTAPRNETEKLWMELFMEPSSFYDNRKEKVGRQPDFKRKSDGEALWVEDDRSPDWVLQNLQLLPGNMPYTGTRQGLKYPGFMPHQPASETEAEWMDLFNHYQRWWDNRLNKRNPRQPDFKNKRNGDKALWVDSRSTPQWVRDHIDEALPPPPETRS